MRNLNPLRPDADPVNADWLKKKGKDWLKKLGKPATPKKKK